MASRAYIIASEIREQHVSDLLRFAPDLVFVYTPGGDVDVAVGLTALMPRKAVAVGLIASAGIPVFAAAEERLALPGTRFLWHPPALSVGHRSLPELKTATKDLDWWFEWACDLLGTRTRRSCDWWRRPGTSDTSMLMGTAAAAECGLIDRVVCGLEELGPLKFSAGEIASAGGDACGRALPGVDPRCNA